jgi:hypothetical protein
VVRAGRVLAPPRDRLILEGIRYGLMQELCDAEGILHALYLQLTSTGAEVRRSDGLPVEVPENGLIILLDGEPGEPEVTLSPMTWHYEHRAEAEVYVANRSDRDQVFDLLRIAVGSVIAEDRTLGGLCDWVEAEAPKPMDLPVDGGLPIKCASIPIVLHYVTTDPLN